MQESGLVSKGNQKWYQTIKNKTIAENRKQDQSKELTEEESKQSKNMRGK